MATVATGATMSLDGFIADDNDRVGPLFEWYSNGSVEVRGTDPDRVFRVSPASASYLNSYWPKVAATVIGRRLFDITNGWNGVPAVGERVFVVTHQTPEDWPFPDAPFTFVTDGVQSAVEQAKAFAGDRIVSVAAGNIGGQAFELGLIDDVHIDLVPVIFGTGKRFFGDYDGSHILLDNPTVVQGNRVTHLHYRVRR